jgi:hypothetical protein
MKKWLIVLLTLTLAIAATTAVTFAMVGGGSSEEVQYEVRVQFNSSATQNDIGEVEALLRTYDEDLEFLTTRCFPRMGYAVLTADATDFCPTVEAELEAKSYVDDVSCGPCTGSRCGPEGPPPCDPPASGLSVDVMHWTSVDLETGQPGGGCATVLTWQDNSNDERGLRIERRRDGSTTWQLIQEVPPHTTEYTDLDVCGDYCYRVGAVGASGLSGYSNEACCGPEEPAPGGTATSTAITGTVMDVALSARIITLAEPVEGFEVVALTEQTKLVSPSGGEATLQDVRRGMRIQASGQAGESGALLAEVVLILSDEAPAPVDPRSEPSDTDVVDYLYDVTVRFNTSVTQADIDELAAVLRTYDDELEEFVIMESWPPIGRALLKDGLNLCPTLLAELEGKSYVDHASCEPLLGH